MSFPRQMAFLVCLLLSACDTACELPSIHQWTKPEQQQIAAEHNALPKDDVLRGVLDEWEGLRAELK